jgi:SAM-dependent methyltransferase
LNNGRASSLFDSGPATDAPTAGESYDAVPYESHAISDTSPDSLATMAALFGLHPADVWTCRVLELGCAGAGNLVAMALPLPGARFFGVDASERQIDEGRALVREMGLRNVDLLAADFLKLPADLPVFDYIICHGVYSWVSPEVQAKILEVLGGHLAPQGVAYLSYNTYPGGHLRLMAREMMRFHVRNLGDPSESTLQARAIFQLIQRFAASRPGPYAKILEYLSGHLDQEPDWYVFHEYLEEHNQPVYFAELVERARGHGLEYLAPARFIPWEHRLPPEAGDISRLADRVVREQYLDFLCNRIFRRTLFCRQGLAVADRLLPEALGGLRAFARATATDPAQDVRSEREEEFLTLAQEKFRSERPVVKAILMSLSEQSPRAIPVPELRQTVAARLEGCSPSETSPDEFARALLALHVSNALGLRTSSGSFVLSAGERPVASPLARWLAARGRPAVNLRHETLELSDLQETLVPLLDGSRDRALLSAAVLAAIGEGKLGIENSAGETLEDPAAMEDVVATAVDENLERLAAACFLTA